MPAPAPDHLDAVVRRVVEDVGGTVSHHDAVALRLGSGGQVLVDRLAACGVRTDTANGSWASIQLPRRYPVLLVDPGPAADAAIVHCAVQHAWPGALVVLLTSTDPTVTRELAERFDLGAVSPTIDDGAGFAMYRRTERFTVHDLVFEARAGIRRVEPLGLAVALAGPTPPLVIDTRTLTDRDRFGVIAGSIHAPRTVLEWHLDPANGYQHPAITSFDQPMVIVCNGGYSSSLAVANLMRLGFSDVADLVGGHHAWVAEGLPVVEPDQAHLDL